MNKNLLIFFSILFLIPFSTPIAAMEPEVEQADQKQGAEKSPSAAKKNKPRKKQAAQSPAAVAGDAHFHLQPVPMAAAQPAVADEPAADEAEGAVVPAVKEDVIEIELNPADTVKFLQQKATNYVLGTHNTLLTRLKALNKNEVVSKSLANQTVILSAVKNLVELCGAENCVLKKACLDDIAQLLKYAETFRGGKPVITLDKGPADSLKAFLDNHQRKLFAEFYAIYLEQIKPVRQIAGLVDGIVRIQGNKPSGDINLTTLSHANMKALDKIMRDMAGQKPGQDAKDQS